MTFTRGELEALGPTGLAALEAILDEQLQLRDAGRSPWLCADPTCDGQPHGARFPGPHARPNQRPPEGDWALWLLLAGRGFGKTRCGGEWSWRMAKHLERGALVAPTAADARDVMVEGESGILACAPPTFRPVYEPSKRKLTYPNGAIQMLYSADEPDRLRGPQHHYAWADELAAWKKLQYGWDMLMMGLRLGDHPQVAATTTPRPLPLIKDLLKRESTAITRGTTYDNLTNLAESFKQNVLDRYEGTTLGRQELHAEVLDDLPGALLSRAVLERNRVDAVPDLLLKIVAMDPAGTGAGDETGLIAGGWGADGHTYLTHDWSDHLSPEAATRRAWELFETSGADVLVYEDNFGKGWVQEVMTRAWKDRHGATSHPPLEQVTASAGKQLRAQPVVMRYEQGRVHHAGEFPVLEDQLTTWMPHEPDQRFKSPDRVDAAVHLDTYLVKRFVKNVITLSSPFRRGQSRAAS